MADNSASTQANRLWPYLLPRIQKVSRNGNGNGNGGGSAVSGGRLATLQDVNLVTPTDGQVLTYDAATSMWRNEDATGGGGGGGPTYTAGNGIAILADVISTKQQTAGGINADSTGLFIRKPSNSGLVVDSTGLYVGAGIGIDILGGVTSVDATEITDTTQGLGVSSNLIYVRAAAGGGIEFAGDGSLRVDEDASFQWTATHSFSQDIQLDADLDFIGAQSITTSSGALTVIPTGDLNLNPGGDDVFILGGSRIGTDNFASQLTGWRIDYAGGGDFRYLYTDELHAKAFIADLEQALAGGQIITKSVTILAADFTAPGPGGAATLVVKDLPSANNMAVFQAGDIVRLRQFSRAGGSLSITNCWGVVTGYSDGPGAGEQSWTFTRSVSPNAGAMITGSVIAKDAILLDYGTSGNGYYEVNAIDGVYAANSPYAQVVTWTGHPATGSSLRLRIGNLAGVSDAALSPSGYGLYSDNAYLHGVVRTAETLMDDEGLAIKYSQTGPYDISGLHSLIAWWEDLDTRSGDPMALVSAHHDVSTPGMHNDQLSLHVTKQIDSSYSMLVLRAIDHESLIPEDETTGSAIALLSDMQIQVQATNTFFYGHALPGWDFTEVPYDLGSASKRWRNLYVDHLYVSGSIAGDTISGAEWEYPGSMIIDANAATNTVVSVTNQGTGTASFSVEGNITLGGTVDGVDISAHVANPAAHHALATAGDGIIVIGQQIWLDAAAVAGAGLVAAAGQVLNIGAGSGILVSANSIAIDPAYAMPTTRRVDTDAPLYGGGPLSSDLTLGLTLAPTGGLGTTGGLGLVSSVAGAGLTLTAGVLDVGVGAGLVVGASQVTLDPLLAGNGLTLTAGVLAVGAGDGLVASADTLALDPLVGGAGLTYAAGVLAVGAAAGIQVNANNVQIALASPSGLNTTSGLAVDASLAGAGLALSAGALAVGAGAGITVNANDVAVNQAYTFAWTGSHTWSTGVFRFNTDLQINANLDFLGGTRSITSPAATNLSILPGGDLILDPGGYNVLPGGGTRTDLGDYNRKWSTLYARELYVETLVASSVMATIGGRVMVTPTSSLINDVTVGATTIDLKHNIASFVSGTYLYMESAPNGIPQIEALKITSASPTTITGPPAGFRYTVTRGLNTSGAKAWLAGDAVVSLGKNVSEGYIDLASVQTVKPISPSVQKIGPTITIYSRSSTTNWDDLVPTVTMGNLTSFVDYSATRFGFATGNDLTLAPDAGFSGLTADRVAGVRLFNTALNLYNVGNAILSIDKTNGISFEFGSNAFNTIGWYEDLGVPPAAPTSLMGSIGVARTTAPYSELDIFSMGIAGSYNVGSVRLRGNTPGVGNYYVWLDSSGTYFGSESTPRSQTGGFIKDLIQYFTGSVGIGANASSPAALLHVWNNSATVPTMIAVENDTSGTGGLAAFQAAVPGGFALNMGKNSAGVAAVGIVAASDGFLYNSGGGGSADLAIQNRNTAGNIKFAVGAGSSPMLNIAASGNVGIGAQSASAAQNLHVWNNSASVLTAIRVQNDTSGTGGQAALQAQVGSFSLNMGKNSAGVAAVGIINPSDGYLWNSSGGLGGDLAIQNRNTAGNIKFAVGTGTTPMLNIASTGAVTIPGAITAQSTLAVTGITTATGVINANGGVSFGNTTFNDYDENSVAWTPTFGQAGTAAAFTYGTRSGKYVKIGNMIFVQALISWTARTGGTGAAYVNLPIASGGTNPATQTLHGMLASSSTVWGITLAVPNGSLTTVNLYQAQGTSFLNINDVPASGTFYYSGTYFYK